MKRSSNRILSSHVGSIVRPPEVLELMKLKESGQPYDKQEFEARVKRTVDEVVKHQAAIGIDIPSDGEFSKSSFSGYANERLTGFEMKKPPPGQTGNLGRGREYKQFKEFFDETGADGGGNMVAYCTGPITYKGQALAQRDIENFRAALKGTKIEEAFIPAAAPGTFELQRKNEYYKTEEEYLFAIADALSHEYKAIVDAGFILQLDDPRVVVQWDVHDPAPSIADFRKFAALRVEAINRAVKGLPADRIRYHLCWRSGHTPHTTDIDLRHMVDIIMNVHAEAISMEAANPRHEHEWAVWETVWLDGRILIPGLISHATNIVEHPELVAQRIVTYAKVAGRENVIGATDCGFAQGAFIRRVHPQIMWAKLEALAEGAHIASGQLWPKGIAK